MLTAAGVLPPSRPNPWPLLSSPLVATSLQQSINNSSTIYRVTIHPAPTHLTPHAARDTPRRNFYLDTRAENKPSRSLKLYNHREGPYYCNFQNLWYLTIVLNVKALVGALNQEKAQVSSLWSFVSSSNKAIKILTLSIAPTYNYSHSPLFSTRKLEVSLRGQIWALSHRCSFCAV